MSTQQLVVENLALAAAIAGNMSRRLPRHLDLQDILQDARVGLIDAATRYDAKRRVSFGSYARQRVGGAVLDGLRRLDHLSGHQRAIVKAEGAEISPEPLHLSPPEQIPGVLVAPEQYAACAERECLLAATMDALPARLRLVLRAYYHRGMTMREIGFYLEVSESRVSQLHARALRLLRRYFEMRGFTSASQLAIPDYTLGVRL
jgi:RNA polymerase sigma factor for flagellar operon FliA